MTVFNDGLKALIIDVFLRIQGCAVEAAFMDMFSRYSAQIKPVFLCYQLHHDSHQHEYDLLVRFQVETAILHVVTELASALTDSKSQTSLIWPISEYDSFYSWYRLSDADCEKIENLAVIARLQNNLPSTISQISDDLLSELCERYMGEFYTPLAIAQHLIEVAEFRPSDLFEGKKAVDPACGGGIILSLIAQQVLTYAAETTIPAVIVWDTLNRQIHGFDIQPFAVTLTRTQLILASISSLGNVDWKNSLFTNVSLTDPLRDKVDCWYNEDEKYHYIIGNPPYMSVKKSGIEYIQNYKEVLYGHPNLYQLFLWWAARSTVQGGVISFLIPQSILAGNFFQNLRKALIESTHLQSITRMIDRKGVVGDADHQMMVLCLRVESIPRSEHLVDIRVTRNGHGLSEVNLYQITQPRIVRKISESTVIWIVSNNVIDYTIAEYIEAKCKTIAELEGLTVGNGGYVWNQHKELLHSEKEPSDLPLISSASIKPFSLVFPFSGSHPSHKRQYSTKSFQVVDKIHEGPAILLQRTTPRKAGRRLVAGYTTVRFLEQYPQYFLENHVNYAKILPTSHLRSDGVLGWLNSDILNFIFQLRNGTSHISIYELNLLPIPHDLLVEISEGVMWILSSTSDIQRKRYIVELNEFMFDWFGLSVQHRQRISEVLGRKERE